MTAKEIVNELNAKKGFRTPELLRKWTKIQISNYLKDTFNCSQKLCDEVIDIIKNPNEINESLFQTYLEKSGGTILTNSTKPATEGITQILINSEKEEFMADQIKRILVNAYLSAKEKKPNLNKELFFKTLISDLSKI